MVHLPASFADSYSGGICGLAIRVLAMAWAAVSVGELARLEVAGLHI